MYLLFYCTFCLESFKFKYLIFPFILLIFIYLTNGFFFLKIFQKSFYLI